MTTKLPLFHMTLAYRLSLSIDSLEFDNSIAVLLVHSFTLCMLGNFCMLLFVCRYFFKNWLQLSKPYLRTEKKVFEILEHLPYTTFYPYTANIFVLKMLSAYYVCCIYSIALQKTFTMEINAMSPDLTAFNLGPYCLQYRLPKYKDSRQQLSRIAVKVFRLSKFEQTQ